MDVLTIECVNFHFIEEVEKKQNRMIDMIYNRACFTGVRHKPISLCHLQTLIIHCVKSVFYTLVVVVGFFSILCI